MSLIRVLALSSSRVKNSGYLENASPLIANFLGTRPLRIAFIPFADADSNYDNYLQKVKEGLRDLPHLIDVVTPENAPTLVRQAEVIMVGGGNTFKLLHHLYHYQLLDLIQEKVCAGTPYVGWSAGSNITGLSIGTTNDMPIIEPESFEALASLPFQINPHYANAVIPGHNGETRDERLTEYLKVNKSASIIALPEGTALQRNANTLHVIGAAPATLFRNQAQTNELERISLDVDQDISWLL